jgi:DNA processing protein
MLPARQALLILNALPGLGPLTLNRLLARFHTPTAILEASAQHLESVPGVGPVISSAIRSWRTHFDLEAEEARIAKANAAWITRIDDHYPVWLKQIPDHPIALYTRGRLDRLPSAVALVGTRKPSSYGAGLAREFAEGLARAGVVVVSGLARGIDAAAHRGALAAGGRTIGVAGAGLDHVFPSEHVDLYEAVAAGGAVISEFRFGRPPDKQTFPIRNRVVAGLSQATVIIESAGSGGAMITANFAADYGRTVLAVPGRVDQVTSEGPHRLIREGATLCRSLDDILEEIGARKPAQQELPLNPQPDEPPPEEFAALLQSLVPGECQSFDQIAGNSDLHPGLLQAKLLELELEGWVRRRSDGCYERVRRRGTQA